MSGEIYFPSDEFVDKPPHDLDLAADYLELTALLSHDRQAFGQDIVDALEQTADADFVDVDDELRRREEISSSAINRIARRGRVLKNSYPFILDQDGHVVTFIADEPTFGHAAYLISLLLSNLRFVSPLLDTADVHPNNEEIKAMRLHFQYFATAAIAAEVVGPAWSFGHPRPDGSGFIEKLTEVWQSIKDGAVKPRNSAPANPKDDLVDVFARREQRDDLPGFVLAAGQVATGKKWKDKSILAHADRGFYSRWFSPEPTTRLVPYHIIPFARPDDEFPDDVIMLGNLLHRLRVPHRVDEAKILVERGVNVEAYDLLGNAVDLVVKYSNRIRSK